MSDYTDVLEGFNEPFVTNPLFAKLVSLLQAKNLVIFFGAGLSSSLFKGWNELVRHLCDECGVDTGGIDFSSELETDCLLQLAQSAKNSDENQFIRLLQEEYSNTGKTCRIYDILCKMEAQAYITLNFDELFYEARVVETNHGCLLPVTHAFKSTEIDRQRLFYLHGCISEIKTTGIVFTASEYENAYEENSLRSRFVKALFSECNILFLGCQLKDPVFAKVFNKAKLIRRQFLAENPNSLNELFILFPYVYKTSEDGCRSQERDLGTEELRKKFYGELGITVVIYDPIDGKHVGLEQALQNLRGGVARRGKNSYEGGTLR